MTTQPKPDSLNGFHAVNVARQHEAFAPAHSLMELSACVQEEVGELAGCLLGITGAKKRKAHKTKPDALDGVADAITYLSLVAAQLGCDDLEKLLGDTFNMVSERAGSKLTTRLGQLDGQRAAVPVPAVGLESNCGNCWACLELLPKVEGDVFDSRFCRMVVCAQCGNKRCPKANNHWHECSGSNEPGQPGSAYADAPVAAPPAQPTAVEPIEAALKARIAALPDDKLSALWDNLQKLADAPDEPMPTDEKLIAYVRHDDGSRTPITPKQWAQAVLAHPKPAAPPVPVAGELPESPFSFAELRGLLKVKELTLKADQTRELVTEFENLEWLLSSRNQSIAQLDGAVDTMRKERDAALARVDTLKAGIEKLTAEQAARVGDSVAAAAQVERLEGQLAIAKANREVQHGLYVEYRAKAEGGELVLTASNARAAKLEAQVENLKTTIEGLTSDPIVAPVATSEPAIRKGPFLQIRDPSTGEWRIGKFKDRPAADPPATPEPVTGEEPE